MSEMRSASHAERETRTDDEAEQYRFAVRGHLGAQAAEWFEGMTVTNGPGGIAEITGPIIDQAALYALLARIQSLGLPLLAVNRGPPDTPPRSDHER